MRGATFLELAGRQMLCAQRVSRDGAFVMHDPMRECGELFSFRLDSDSVRLLVSV